MSLAPWRSLITRALHQNRSLVYARYVQLATVRENGFPANSYLAPGNSNVNSVTKC